MSHMPQPGSHQPASYEPHRGTMVLVLGILSLVLCQLCGPFAWIMGKNDLKKMDAGRMDPDGRGLTQGGMICGIVGSILLALGLLLSLLWVVFAVILVGAAASQGGP